MGRNSSRFRGYLLLINLEYGFIHNLMITGSKYKGLIHSGASHPAGGNLAL